MVKNKSMSKWLGPNPLYKFHHHHHLYATFVSLSLQKSFINNNEEENKTSFFLFYFLYSPSQRPPFVFPLLEKEIYSTSNNYYQGIVFDIFRPIKDKQNIDHRNIGSFYVNYFVFN